MQIPRDTGPLMLDYYKDQWYFARQNVLEDIAATG